MGRRKERRLAAAAGRRVKLDLFAEPSGDSVGSSAQREVGGDGDSKTDAQLPSSPSSSGKQPQNPLLLLEQYSDDELDDDPDELHNHDVAEDASIDIDEEAKAAGKETEYAEINHGKDPTAQKVEQLLMDNDSAPQDPLQKHDKESNAEIACDDLQKRTNKMEESAYPAASDEHLTGDVSSGWKMVLHEESNQYYYWNIVTGETSWEVPDAFVEETVATFAEKIVGDTAGNLDAVMSAYKSSMPLDMEENDITSGKIDVDPMVNGQTSDSAGQGTNEDGSDLGFKGDSIEDGEVNRDANQASGTSMLGIHFVESNSGTDLPMQLMKHCESMLERLNAVKGLNCDVEGQDLKLRCTLETKIRLADIKALASQGSLLLAFWQHSEYQLKQLEAHVDELIRRNNSASIVGFEAALGSHEDVSDDIEIDKALLAAMKSHAEHNPETSNFEVHNDGATKHVTSACYPITDHDNDFGGQSEITRSETESELTPGPALHSVEDVDMDVDMEVEDASPIKSPDGGASGAQYHVPMELSNMQNSLAGQEPVVPGQVFSAPPPVEDWIRPPPPDNEPFPPPPPDDEPFPPPPPPDDPPETPYPLSHSGSVQPYPYSDQYALPYAVPNLGYYGQTNLEASGTTLYTHSEGGQVAVSHLPQYYEAIPNIYAATPVIVDPVEPTAYYGLQNGTVNPVSLISGTAQSSGTLSEPVLETIDSRGAGDSHSEAVSNLLPKTNLSLVNSGHDTTNAAPEVPETLRSIGDPATSSVTNSVFVSSISGKTTSVSAAPAAAATSKPQSKVPRSKKRPVAVVSTLRSNKKVSSLVDKWKAAKEELHEEEEEPEDAYEILEKKRQKEIEEWRAHQIATGEAKDNANFQPLGGDWRERVKRKRAQKMKEAQRNSPDVSTDGIEQTDLTELSKGLPSGWSTGMILRSKSTMVIPGPQKQPGAGPQDRYY